MIYELDRFATASVQLAAGHASGALHGLDLRGGLAFNFSRMVPRPLYERYTAPQIPAGATDEQGRSLKPRFEMHAYLVDLSGDSMGLPDSERVLLHQVPPVGWWMIKPVDDEYLQRIERYREA